LVAAIASVLTAAVIVPVSCAGGHPQKRGVEAVEAERVQVLKHLVEHAADFLGFADKSEADILHVTTSAVTPEIPAGAHVLIEKKATALAAGDIVVYKVEDMNFLGRVVAVDEKNERLVVGRNEESNRSVAKSALLGRAILNTR
jgi:hypothetical protein